MAIKLGIDASNIRAGGGLTHLASLIEHMDPMEANIGEVVVWGGNTTLARLHQQPWLRKVHESWLDRSLAHRIAWQQLLLPRAIATCQIDVFFSPGGTLPAVPAIPTVTMSQNLLPFEPDEAARYHRDTLMSLRLGLLKHAQLRAFRRASGVIFLSNYASEMIRPRLPANVRSAIIPHGLESRFFLQPRATLPLEAFSESRPFKVLYVSIIDRYKHQYQVIQAIASLRSEGLPICLELIGPAYSPALRELQPILQAAASGARFVEYRGSLPFEGLHVAYQQADAFVFASSCENLPIILLEAMAAGLPIACSDRGPMPEILGDAGLFFNPESAASISAALRRIVVEPETREWLAKASYERAGTFSWKRCAADTLAFIAKLGASQV